MARDRFITGLDVGTSNICALVGRVDPAGNIEVVGQGLSRSKGLSDGLVVDLEELSASISKAMEEAQKSSSLEIYSVFANITGTHLRGYNRQGMINLAEREKGISNRDIKNAIDYAKAISIPLDQGILHVIPQGYAVDDQDGVKNPLGMAGKRLTAAVHVVVVNLAQRENLKKCLHRAGFEVEGIVSEHLATSYAILTKEEKDLGVILVNMGGGTTDIIIFINGAPWYTDVLSLGGLRLTEMISTSLKTPIDSAEDIKVRYGSALPSMVKSDEPIIAPGISGRPQRKLTRRSLAELIEPEMKKMLCSLRERIEQSGYQERAVSGIVITGGGTLLEGTTEMAEATLRLPIKVGLAYGVQAATKLLSNPIYTAAIGLIRYGAELVHKRSRLDEKGILGKTIGRVRDWIQDYF